MLRIFQPKFFKYNLPIFLLLISFTLFLRPSQSVGGEFIVKFNSEVSFQIEVTGKIRVNHPQLQSVIERYEIQKVSQLFAAFRQAPIPVARIYKFRLPDSTRAKALFEELKTLTVVEYVEPNYRFRVFQQNSDPEFFRQWYLHAIKAPQAWNQQTGQPDVIVGVIDTGIDYHHPDLQGQLWVNPLEDVNGNGMLDSLDNNGIDDDGNGYIDDVIGWDFTDAPDFPDAGDYLLPDNDPMDEFLTGHGTPIAGVIAAARNNGLGIAGVAPGVRVMALRAGTASGYLEEDDVAEAVVYAVENGCRIINMSFGDVVFSYLLRDVIHYGTTRGVIFVAAAGNSGNSLPNYPAAYDETIAVGATTRDGNLAGFSSYGSKLDLVAPGEEIYSCQIGGGYGYHAGTSFAAPIASAALALIWSAHPQFSAPEVQGTLFASCVDKGAVGWDTLYGHGQVDLLRALGNQTPGFVELLFPYEQAGISGAKLTILGTAFSPYFQSYELWYGVGETPSTFEFLYHHQGGQVIGDTLFEWDISSLPDTVYTLSLRMQQPPFPELVRNTRFEIDHTMPVLTLLDTIPVLKGIHYGYLFHLQTDDRTRVEIQYRAPGSGSQWNRKTSEYFREEHYLLLTQADWTGPFEFRIVMQNSAGLVNEEPAGGNYYRLDLSHIPPIRNMFTFREHLPSSGYLLFRQTDFDGDGLPEWVISRSSANLVFGNLEIWEWQNGNFLKQAESSFPAIPRDAADIDGDGRGELLAGYGQMSMILQADQPGQFPGTVVWMDTTNFWGARLVNLDSDSTLEMLAIHQGIWKIFDLQKRGFQPALQQTLENPSDGNNQYGIPWADVGDLDGDGYREIVFGDYDGDIVLFEENSSHHYENRFWKKLTGTDATHLFRIGDMNGDGRDELVTVTKRVPPDATESSVDASYWFLEVWRWDGQDSLVHLWQQKVHGVVEQKGTFSGLSLLDVNHDGTLEIVFTPYPYGYIFQFQNNTWQPVWFADFFNSNQVLLDDFDGDGIGQLLANTSRGLALYDDISGGNAPLPPYQVQAIPLDTQSVRLQWHYAGSAEAFRVYRKEETTTFQMLGQTQESFYLDGALQKNRTYFYAVTVVDSTYPVPESPLSEEVSATPMPPPRIDTLIVENSHQLKLLFSRAASQEALDPSHFFLQPEGEHPRSVIRVAGGMGCLLSFGEEFGDGNHILIISGLTDTQGMPFAPDSLSLIFTYHSTSSDFYLERVELVDKVRLVLIFSQPVDTLSARDVSHYTLSPDGMVEEARVGELPNQVHLRLNRQTRLGSLGVPYFIEVNGLRDASGNLINSSFGNRLAIVQAASDLSRVLVYPNPYRLEKGQNQLMFGNLPAECEIFIYSAGGQFIRRLKENDGNGGIGWDLRSEQGQTVGSGVYYFIVRSGEQQRKGKFVIIK